MAEVKSEEMNELNEESKWWIDVKLFKDQQIATKFACQQLMIHILYVVFQ